MTGIIKVLDVSVFLGLAFVVFANATWNARVTAGLVLAVAGFALWMLARRQLGRSFAIRAEARQLVTHGLYARVRHPVYLFGEMAYAGLLLALGRPAGVVLLFLLWLGQRRRMKREDAVLEQAFGEEYRRYRAATWL